MPDCNDTLRELELFLDQELSEGARDEIRRHLEGCPHCLETFDFHAELKTVIATKCHNDEMPPGLMGKIAACFGDEMLGSPADPDPSVAGHPDPA